MQETTPVGSDHDTLIEIKVLLSQLTLEVKSLREGTHSQLSDHERRIRSMEDLAIRLQPDALVEKYDTVAAQVQDFRSRLKVYAAIITFLASILAAVIGQLVRHYLSIHL